MAEEINMTGVVTLYMKIHIGVKTIHQFYKTTLTNTEGIISFEGLYKKVHRLSPKHSNKVLQQLRALKGENDMICI
ncbi:MAG: hypothetical protein ACI9AR_000313 [Flavobacteriaceae bacterium]|jgi:hypothetical protein